MDKAEIRAAADKLMGVQEISTQRSITIYRHAHRFLQRDEIEAALTAACAQGWDEGVGAVAKDCPHGVAGFHTREAIRRLKKGKES